MEIIPVIDLLDTCVVHARRGERHNYRPIQSSLCKSSQPLDVVQGLLKLYPFKQLYIADLNAIQKRGNHQATVASIISAYPALNIWLDCGISCMDDLTNWQDLGIDFVIGSECLGDLKTYISLQQTDNHLLSLDFDTQDYLGPTELLDQPALWPDRVIAMTLSQVGSESGPDVARLNDLYSRSDKQKIYAAGGIRHIEDVLALKNIGLSGALVATALHCGNITSSEIASIVRLEPVQ